MSLVSYGTSPSAAEPAKIQNNGFWPQIDPADFRAVERIDSSVTDPRVERELIVALTDVNRQLAEWQLQHQSAGVATIDQVPHPSWARESHFTDLYLRAVYATAMATLLERHREYSATSAGDAKGLAKDEAADDYRRDARFAISELLGEQHSVVELI